MYILQTGRPAGLLSGEEEVRFDYMEVELAHCLSYTFESGTVFLGKGKKDADTEMAMGSTHIPKHVSQSPKLLREGEMTTEWTERRMYDSVRLRLQPNLRRRQEEINIAYCRPSSLSLSLSLFRALL